MRTSLPHTLRERRRSRADQHRRKARADQDGAASVTREIVSQPADRALQRVRNAGGPIDEAYYACECGFLFTAPVSTTVTCPHCRAPQAW
jgi:rubrerythrin